MLTRLAAEQKLGEPRIKVEDTVAVAGYPALWQVIARLEGTKDKWVSPALREQDYRRIEELKRTRFSECR